MSYKNVRNCLKNCRIFTYVTVVARTVSCSTLAKEFGSLSAFLLTQKFLLSLRFPDSLNKMQMNAPLKHIHAAHLVNWKKFPCSPNSQCFNK